jgi:S-adenosylmethionine uptake transporter
MSPRIETSASPGEALTRAIFLAVVADALLTLMDALIKSMAAGYPVLEIAFLRFGWGTIWSSVLLAIMRPGWPSRETAIYNSTRSILVVVTATSFFFALGQLPLADAVALSFISPVFIALFGAIFLAEKIDGRILVALGAGLLGMVLIAGGKLGAGTYQAHALLGVAACLVSAVSYALALVLLRARATRDALPIIVWFQNLGPAILLAPGAALVWVSPAPRDVLVFAVIGLIGVTGHCLLASAFARAEAARLAPVQYTTLIWGAVFGYVFFGDFPPLATWLGAGLIILGTMFTQGVGGKRRPARDRAGHKDE